MVKGDRQTVGVLGTFVWDTVDIVGHPIWTGWGGLFYSVAALRAALPDDWVIRPLARVGSDRVSEVRMILEGWGVDTDGLVADRARNNQVGLTYEYTSGHRHTAKNGGVRSWRHDELRHFAEGMDACLVNFVAGNELAGAVAASVLRFAVNGPMYADLHGLRTDDLGAWLESFATVQANQREVTAMASDPAWMRSWSEASDGRPEPHLQLVTLGALGGVWSDEAREFGYEPQLDVRHEDPTGCGDVFAGTMYARLLQGDSVKLSAMVANRAAAVCAGHVGVEGLVEALR